MIGTLVRSWATVRPQGSQVATMATQLFPKPPALLRPLIRWLGCQRGPSAETRPQTENPSKKLY